jgi:hypothetical protein
MPMGYEYVPNYIAPVVYYAPTYDSYDYGGGYSYSSGYRYSSGGDNSSSGAYYPNYVSQSAYYSKETELVAEGNYSSSTQKKKASGGVIGWLSNQWNLAMESESHFDWGSTSATLTTLFIVGLATAPGDAAGVNETYVKSYGGQDSVRPEVGEGIGEGLSDYGEVDEENDREERGEGVTPNDPE